MRKLRDFKCEAGHMQERLVNDDVMVVLCKECPCYAHRQLSAPAGTGNHAHGMMRRSKSNVKSN